MHEVFVEGGLIRKLWSVETDAYRDHLLRLDAESRRNRFGGAIADDIVRTYARQRCYRARLLRGRGAARRRRSAHARAALSARGGGRLQHRETVAKPRCQRSALPVWQSHFAASQDQST